MIHFLFLLVTATTFLRLKLFGCELQKSPGVASLPRERAARAPDRWRWSPARARTDSERLFWQPPPFEAKKLARDHHGRHSCARQRLRSLPLGGRSRPAGRARRTLPLPLALAMLGRSPPLQSFPRSWMQRQRAGGWRQGEGRGKDGDSGGACRATAQHTLEPR